MYTDNHDILDQRAESMAQTIRAVAGASSSNPVVGFIAGEENAAALHLFEMETFPISEFPAFTTLIDGAKHKKTRFVFGIFKGQEVCGLIEPLQMDDCIHENKEQFAVAVNMQMRILSKLNVTELVLKGYTGQCFKEEAKAFDFTFRNSLADAIKEIETAKAKVAKLLN